MLAMALIELAVRLDRLDSIYDAIEEFYCGVRVRLDGPVFKRFGGCHGLARGALTLAATKKLFQETSDATGLARGALTLAATKKLFEETSDATGLARGVLTLAATKKLF
jgi:hypothetical protein